MAALGHNSPERELQALQAQERDSGGRFGTRERPPCLPSDTKPNKSSGLIASKILYTIKNQTEERKGREVV